jgi:hypothetical protein
MASILETPVGRVRMFVGDDIDNPALTDEDIQWLLDDNDGNEGAAIRKAASIIYGRLSTRTRERLDRIESYGHQAFEQYRLFLKDVINNPRSDYNVATIYAGGIDVADVEANRADRSVYNVAIPSDGSYPDV